jgi:hypothetical protein
MTIDTTPHRSRRLLRTAAVTFGLTLGSLAAPAFAAPPEAWNEPDNGSTLGHLLFLLGVPLLVFLVLALLVYLPSMMRRQSSQPTLAFHERSEWFGGPRKGVGGATAAGDTETDPSDKGGASARW